jgi:probable rRNA maturation factor
VTPTLAPEISVRIDDAHWRRNLPRAAALCRRAALAALAAGTRRVRPGAAGIVLTSDAAIAKLNTRFRKRRGPTDVLSFPAGEPAILGDVVIAYGVASRDARADGKPLAHHLSHLVIHGALHLLGYDHQSNDEAERMETLERKVLRGMGIPDPYAVRR